MTKAVLVVGVIRRELVFVLDVRRQKERLATRSFYVADGRGT